MKVSPDRRRPRRHGATATDKRRLSCYQTHAGEGAGGPSLRRRPFSGVDTFVIPDARSAIRNPGANVACVAPGFRGHRYAMPRIVEGYRTGGGRRRWMGYQV
jgi:hypothetical protein